MNHLQQAARKAMNERDAVGLALASGGVALLPGGAQVMWGAWCWPLMPGSIYWADDAIDPANAAIAGWGKRIQYGGTEL
ncbi:Uncharacterised protein [Leclercia adecarboxylata]|uniref:Uncharacterized protein n=1 Tax=Leclercia adecarboxylata TaxID=83655 RepID=A0A4U9IY95_9ENTR|nr:Uncharacterised protein [Leclercia adecarboxylata]